MLLGTWAGGAGILRYLLRLTRLYDPGKVSLLFGLSGMRLRRGGSSADGEYAASIIAKECRGMVGHCQLASVSVYTGE